MAICKIVKIIYPFPANVSIFLSPENKSFLVFKGYKMTALTKNGSQASQPAMTCSNLTIETLEQGVKYVQS